jgi:hypothetical protein
MHAVYELNLVLFKDVRATVNAIYPRVMRAYPLHAEELEKPLRHLPPSSQYVENDNAYVLDDGTSFWLYVGKYVDRERLDDWFIGGEAIEKYPTFRADSRDGGMIQALVAVLRAQSANKQGK